jgi:tubulin-specific chaperone A
MGNSKGLLARLVKELDYYKNEVKENEARLATLREEQRDPYDIKKFEEVLGESYMMVPDTAARLRKNLEDLAEFVESNVFIQQKGALSDPSAWEITAREILKQHMSAVQPTTKNEGPHDDCEVQETNVNGLSDDEAF